MSPLPSSLPAAAQLAAPSDHPDGNPAGAYAGGPDADHPERRCGFVALVGAPNAGKSTLLNTLIGTKLAIVSPKVQTTRRRMLGIAMIGASQLLFVDTPGIFTPNRRLERAMVANAWQGADDADLVVVLVDAARRGIEEETRAIIERLRKDSRPAMLALNKIDRISPPKLLGLAAELNRDGQFTDTFMISAKTGDGVDALRDRLAAAVPQGPWHYPEDQLTDVSMRELAAEITREQVFLQLQQELPYATTVETEVWETLADGSARISQAITVARASQKAIVLGKGGVRIKEIGTAARQELERMTDGRVHLRLFVKVREGWTEDRDQYRTMGLDFDA